MTTIPELWALVASVLSPLRLLFLLLMLLRVEEQEADQPLVLLSGTIQNPDQQRSPAAGDGRRCILLRRAARGCGPPRRPGIEEHSRETARFARARSAG